jgi:hypothetical protein
MPSVCSSFTASLYALHCGCSTGRLMRMCSSTLSMKPTFLSNAAVEKATASWRILLRMIGSWDCLQHGFQSTALRPTSKFISSNLSHHASKLFSMLVRSCSWMELALHFKNNHLRRCTSCWGFDPWADLHFMYPFNAASTTVKCASTRRTGIEVLEYVSTRSSQ